MRLAAPEKIEIFLKKSLHSRTTCVIITKSSVRHAPLAQLDRASGYGPEGRGFESLTACQKIPNPKGFGIFCFYQFTRFSLLHASGDAHIPRDRRTSSHISERQRQRRRSRDDAKFRPRSTGNPACRPKRKSRNHPVSGASLGTFCAHRKYPAGGTDKLIPTPVTQKIGLRAAIIRKHR